MNVLLFIVSLALIFVGSSLFTNGVEWIGRKFNLSEGVVGSVLAAVGTALPETVIPLIAIFIVSGSAGEDVGIGAILGAPFMLGTLALFITGMAVLILRRRRPMGAKIDLESRITERDLGVFFCVYLGAVAVALVIPTPMKAWIAPLFVALYVIYVWRVFKTGKGTLDAASEPLTFDSWSARLRRVTTRQTPSLSLVVAQTAVSVAFIIIGAQLFVNQIVSLAEQLHASAVILALVIAPVATELPEKLNSVLWVSQGKDALALGNITGAMVFQSCIPVAFGIAFTPWVLGPVELASAALALIAGLWVGVLTARAKLTPTALIFNGVLYVLFLSLVLRG
ncbi:MAG TPA: sodium:calcium antiporter [Candidatus Bathyarchaeia archaeon]|nr:sodium:calcium antiporter [Candidatus Bathyarchaeia archaeon]